MSTKEIKALCRHFIEEFSKGKAAAMAVLEETNATNAVYHSGTGEDIRGLKDIKQFFSNFLSAFPDAHGTLDDIVVEGDKVAQRWTLTATHKGEFMGIPPTNRKITIWAVEIDRVAGGKFVEIWERFDTLGFMQQLGVVPKSGKGK
jgi:predicted ester cyclase